MTRAHTLISLALRVVGVSASLLGASCAAPTPRNPLEEERPTPREDEDGALDALPLDALLPTAARSLCEASLRCCTSVEEQAVVFGAIASSDEDGRYADLLDRLPPRAPLGDDCEELVQEVLARGALGSWTDAAHRGAVGYRADEALACARALDAAQCGAQARGALLDSTCFAFAAPAGGDAQRRMFVRTAVEGACTKIVDGFGGMLYGTCDPRAAFCCVPDGEGGCTLGAPEDTGTCAPVAGEGEPCSLFPTLQLCATGAECDAGTSTCAAPLTTPLANGDACFDEASYRLLGACVDGWCDVLGSGRCEPRRDDGAACASAEECDSGDCEAGACATPSTCGG